MRIDPNSFFAQHEKRLQGQSLGGVTSFLFSRGRRPLGGIELGGGHPPRNPRSGILWPEFANTARDRRGEECSRCVLQ